MTNALKETLDAALEIANPFRRAEALAELVPHLAGEAKLRALREGLAAAFEIDEGEGVDRRVDALNAFAPLLGSELDLESISMLRLVIIDLLYENIGNGRREDILRFCAEKSIFVPPVLDKYTIAAIAGYIVEVCNHWKWQ